MKKIIEFFKKIFAWILSLFLDRKHLKKNRMNKKRVYAHEVSSKAVPVKEFSHRDEDMGSAHVIKSYPYTEAKELKSIVELVEELKEKIISEPDIEKKVDSKELAETIKKIDEIKEVVNKNLTVMQTEEIKEILHESIKDPEVSVTKEEKIDKIKKDINEVVDNKLDKHEKDLIEKACEKYEKVNYVIATTVEIEEIEKDLKDLADEIKVNNHKKNYYVDKINEIKKKIERLQKINKIPSVYEELERLKEDFYTKEHDKYDLLYNKEVFINLDQQCDELLETIETREKEQEVIKVEQKEAREEREREEHQKRVEQEQQREEERERRQAEKDEYIDNIIKRYRDLKIAADLISTGIIFHALRKKNKSIVQVLQDDYDDFLRGEDAPFEFDRNRRKTEVAVLYNNLLETLTGYQGLPFEPVMHINYPYQNLLEETLAVKDTVDRMTTAKTGHDMVMDEKSVMVSDKLNSELTMEKENNRAKGKVDKVLIRKVGEQ